MRFGTSTWFFQEYPVIEALKHIWDCGFHAAEIWMEHLWKPEQSTKEIIRYAQDLGMELTLHSSSYDLNITSTNPGIRQESLRQVKQSILIGKQLGVKTVVVHPGHLSSSKGNVDDGHFAASIPRSDSPMSAPSHRRNGRWQESPARRPC